MRLETSWICCCSVAVDRQALPSDVSHQPQATGNNSRTGNHQACHDGTTFPFRSAEGAYCLISGAWARAGRRWWCRARGSRAASAGRDRSWHYRSILIERGGGRDGGIGEPRQSINVTGFWGWGYGSQCPGGVECCDQSLATLSILSTPRKSAGGCYDIRR